MNAIKESATHRFNAELPRQRRPERMLDETAAKRPLWRFVQSRRSNIGMRVIACAS